MGRSEKDGGEDRIDWLLSFWWMIRGHANNNLLAGKDCLLLDLSFLVCCKLWYQEHIFSTVHGTFRTVFLLLKIAAWTLNSEGQYVKSPKYFMNDTVLLCQIKGDDESLISDRTKAGSLLENFVALEIIKQISWFVLPLRLLHFSMHKGAEVDLVIETSKKQLIGVEVKSKASLNNYDFKVLKKLAELAGKKFKKGIVLYTGEHVLGGFGGNNLHAVPLPNLWKH